MWIVWRKKPHIPYISHDSRKREESILDKDDEHGIIMWIKQKKKQTKLDDANN